MIRFLFLKFTLTIVKKGYIRGVGKTEVRGGCLGASSPGASAFKKNCVTITSPCFIDPF